MGAQHTRAGGAAGSGRGPGGGGGLGDSQAPHRWPIGGHVVRLPLDAPGWVVRVGPWVRVKGPASCHFRPACQTGRLVGGADVGPREGALVPGGLLRAPRALPGRLGPFVRPCPPPVTTGATCLVATSNPALAARLLWAPSGHGGLLRGHPVFLAGTCGWRRAVSPQGVGACHRHVLKLVQQQREGPILGAFAAPHDGLGCRAMAGWGPGKEGDTGRVSDTQGQDNTTHTETRQRRNEEMPWGDDGAGRAGAAPGRPLQPRPQHLVMGHKRGPEGRPSHQSGCCPQAGCSLEKHPVFLLSSRLGGSPCPEWWRGRRAEATPPHNQPRRAANYRMLQPGPSLALPPL